MSCSSEIYRKVPQNIPRVFIQLIKNNIQNTATPDLHKVKVDDLELVKETCNNKFLRWNLVNTLYPGRTKSSLTLKDQNNSDLSTIPTRYFKFPILPKWKEVHFKTRNNIYPSNEFIKRRFKSNAENCSICETSLETTERLFYECETVQNLWKSLQDLTWSSSRNTDSCYFQNILMGVILREEKREFLLNNLIIITKYYTHMCRWAKPPLHGLLLRMNCPCYRNV